MGGYAKRDSFCMLVAMSDEIAALRQENLALRAQLADLEREVGGHGAALLRSVLEAMPAFITRVDPELRVVFLNRYVSGYAAEQVIGTSVFDYFSPDDKPAAKACMERVLATGENGMFHVLGSGPDGSTRNYETHVVPVTDLDGRRGLCLVAIDITLHIERERALQQSEDALRVAIEATGMGLWRWDPATGKVTWNEAMYGITGRDEPTTTDTWVNELTHPDDREELTNALRGWSEQAERPLPMHRIVRPDGTIRWVVSSGRGIRDEQGKLVSLIGGVLDVTEQRAVEERLRQTQKLEALGALTAGVAHNFNNMLAVILPFVEGALESPTCHAPELGNAALHAAGRAAEMIRQLTTLAGGRPSGRKSVRDLSAVARSATQICDQLFKGQLTIHVAGGEAAFPALCDEAGIEQTLVNLLLNARDALRESEQPNPEITVQLREVASRDVPPFPGRQQRDYVVIDVRDNGTGMDEATRARLFEPFFTTKGPDRGTGLGLATSHAVVREHGGFIFCTSRPGVGSTFSVYLPVAEREPRASGPQSTSQPALEKQLRVLVVEDDAMVRRTTVALLRSGGHVVREAATPKSALEQLQSPDQFDAVLLDRSMPGGGGAPLVEAIRRLAPRVCLVYFTGGDVPEDEQARVDAVLYKPLGARDLLSKLDDICRKGRAARSEGREAS